MSALLLPLVGFAFLDSLNVLNLGVTSVVVYDSRLRRRSPLPAGVSYLAGVYVATAVFGVCVVLGLSFLTHRVDVDVTPTVRYWVALVLGLGLIGIGTLPTSSGPRPPLWALNVARRNPWLFAVVGAVVGFGQAGTSVPYLTALTMVSAQVTLPAAWPVLVAVYCALALVPAAAVLALSVRRSAGARRLQRRLVRTVFRYGPIVVRCLFLGAGVLLVGDALWHWRDLW